MTSTMATRFRWWLIILVAIGTPVAARAVPDVVEEDESGDDTLRYYLSKSTVVVSGEVFDGPQGASFDAGVSRYSFKLKVKEVLYGIMLDPEFTVVTERMERDATEHQPFFKKGKLVILFLRLKKNDRGLVLWREADPWFGVQQYNEGMALSLKRLAKEE